MGIGAQAVEVSVPLGGPCDYVQGVRIEMTVIDAANKVQFAQTELELDQLPETFALETTLNLGDDSWRVVAAQPVTRGEVERAGRLRLTVRKVEVKTVPVPFDRSKIKFGMPTVCDPLPAMDGSISLADPRIFVIDEDLWRDVELVAQSCAADVESNFAAIRAIRAVETGPFSDLHPRVAPVTPLSGTGLRLAHVGAALGSAAERAGGVVIDTRGAGFVPGSFAFRLPDDGHVYGYCVGAEVAVLGLHRSGSRPELPVAASGLAGLMRQFSLDLIVWPYAERITDVGALENWYRSGRACSKMPW
jgi:hypothetical protein